MLPPSNRRNFLKSSATLAGTALLAPDPQFSIRTTPAGLGEKILGHNDFTYRVDQAWGNLNPAQTPVNNCHEMVLDSQGRLIMITDEPKNNIIIYDKSGKLLEHLGSRLPGRTRPHHFRRRR